MIAHTPGPWFVTQPSGRMIITEARIECLAETHGDQAEANALIMAASPALFKALQDIVDNARPLVVPMGGDPDTPFPLRYEPLIEQAIEALALAKGSV